MNELLDYFDTFDDNFLTSPAFTNDFSRRLQDARKRADSRDDEYGWLLNV